MIFVELGAIQKEKQNKKNKKKTTTKKQFKEKTTYRFCFTSYQAWV